MLIPAAELSPEDQEKCRQKSWIAFDPKDGRSLKRSADDFGPGRARKYFLYLPNLMLIVIWAKSDEEAIARADRRG
jgi:hypothetical protein